MRLHFGLTLAVLCSSLARGAVWINEISCKGTRDVCQGHDWIELFNDGAGAVDLSDGYILHDDKGMNSEDAYTFPPGKLVLANDYLLLCTKMDAQGNGGDEDSSNSVGFSNVIADPSSPTFGIGGTDTITLIHRQSDLASDATTTLGSSIYQIVSTVSLPNDDNQNAFDVTYAYDPTTQEYNYTSTPTPLSANVFTRIKTSEELLAEHRAALVGQNFLGRQFFGMDDRGYKVEDAMDDVLELRITMQDGEFNSLMANKSFEVYQSFTNGSVVTTEGEIVATLDSPGRVRAKGQSTLYMAVCLGTNTIPWQLDLASFDETQSMFGVQKLYLRHHMGDYSYSRDYAYNRMLARFGLPYLRTRKVEFYINDVKQGYYSLIEAVDQEYVFARNFPSYNPDNFALYKFKSMSLECGLYPEEEMKKAEARLSETSTPPYSFQRGGHRPVITEEGMLSLKKCGTNFLDNVWNEDYPDSILAYKRYDENCADMLLGEGLIDRDLGTNDWDKPMKKFITDSFRGDNKCDKDCANSDFAATADVEQLLKTFAFYAVSVIADSPLINGNNFYLAQTGDEDNGGPGGWKLVPYDFNAAQVVFCNDKICNPRMVHWSIARPTCESLEGNALAGPLLTDPTLHAKYLEYVREFTDTVYANQTFIEELVQHQAAQEVYVIQDFWSVYGAFYSKEKTPESANWEEEALRFPLLPTMKARAESVREQLAAIDTDTFPRGPNGVGVNGDNEPWEPCPDWRSQEPNTTMCEQGCKYEGCDMPGWTVDSYCDELTGTCSHGDYDEQCRGLPDGEQYPGMEDTEDGRKTFCRFAAGVPVKAAECPAVGAVPQTVQSGGTTVLRSSHVVGTLLFLVTTIAVYLA